MGAVRLRRWLGVLGCVAALALAWGLAGRLVWGPRLAFDRGEWHAAMGPNVYWSDRSDTRRVQMLDDLLARRLRLGMTRGDSERVLGDANQGGDGLYGYVLLYRPRLDQRLLSRVRWRTDHPSL